MTVFDRLFKLANAYAVELQDARNGGAKDTDPCMVGFEQRGLQLSAEIAKPEERAVQLLNEYAF